MRHNRTAILLLLVASVSHAQDANPSEREMIQQLVQQVKALQEKVEALESQQRAGGPSKNFMNSAAFNGEASEKSTTRS